MKYYKVEFTLTPCSQDMCDILSAMAGEAGFESFEEMPTGLVGYVQQQLFDQQQLDNLLADFPFSDTRISYQVSEAEDRDWNAAWEQEGFEPISVGSDIVIHDGRHLPADTTQRIAIEIDAHMAFGTGTHETTRMVCATLAEILRTPDATPGTAHILDCGCGTGILGICALKLGAASCTAYDIDEWSVDNTRHNAVINHVDDRLTTLHGDASLLDSLTQRFDIVMANINRNILLQDMERFQQAMAPTATLILSGFYTADSPLLESKAATLGLQLTHSSHDGDWACLVFQQ